MMIIIIIIMFSHAVEEKKHNFPDPVQGGTKPNSYSELVYSFRNSVEGRQH